uniref:HMMR_C domain-containing protein n=1 Tax=Macrostomum lignano TaxID=282301 RepID=A0A1I8F5W4_9PLAT
LSGRIVAKPTSQSGSSISSFRQYSTSLPGGCWTVSASISIEFAKLTIAGLKARPGRRRARSRASVSSSSSHRGDPQLTFELRGVQARLAASQADEARMREERRKLSEANERLVGESSELRRQLDRARAEAAPRPLTPDAKTRTSLTRLTNPTKPNCWLGSRLSAQARKTRLQQAEESAAASVEASKARCVELTEQLRMTERRAESLMEARTARRDVPLRLESLEKCRSYQSHNATATTKRSALDATAALEESLSVQQVSVARLSSHSQNWSKLQLADACVRWSDQHAETQAALDTAESRIQQLSAERDQLKSRLDDLTDAWDEVGVAAFAFAASVGNWGKIQQLARFAAKWKPATEPGPGCSPSCASRRPRRPPGEPAACSWRRSAAAWSIGEKPWKLRRTRLQTELAELRSELQNRETATSRLAWEKEQRKTIVYLLLFNARSRLDQCMAENARLRDLLRKGQQSSSRMAIEFGSNTSGFSETTVSETILEEKNRQHPEASGSDQPLTSVLKSTSSLGGSASELHQQSLSDSRPATPSPKFAASSELCRQRRLSPRQRLALLAGEAELAQQLTTLPRVTELADLRRRLGDVLSDIELAARRCAETEAANWPPSCTAWSGRMPACGSAADWRRPLPEFPLR